MKISLKSHQHPIKILFKSHENPIEAMIPGPRPGALRHPRACERLGHRSADGLFVSWLSGCTVLALLAFAQATLRRRALVFWFLWG